MWDIYVCRMANMSWKTCIVKQMQSIHQPFFFFFLIFYFLFFAKQVLDERDFTRFKFMMSYWRISYIVQSPRYYMGQHTSALLYIQQNFEKRHDNIDALCRFFISYVFPTVKNRNIIFSVHAFCHIALIRWFVLKLNAHVQCLNVMIISIVNIYHCHWLIQWIILLSSHGYSYGRTCLWYCDKDVNYVTLEFEFVYTFEKK